MRPVLQGSSGAGAASAVGLAAFQPPHPCNAGASVSASWVPYRILLPAWSAGSITVEVVGGPGQSFVVANIMPLQPQMRDHSLSPSELRWRAAVSMEEYFYGVGTILITSCACGPPAGYGQAVGTSLFAS